MPRRPSVTDLPIRKIAVFRALKLGDFLLATPAFRAIRLAFPSADIEYIGLPWSESLAGRYDYFTGFVAFPGFPGLPEREWDPAKVTTFLVDMQRRRYDLALQLHGDGTIVNPLIALLGARMSAGYFSAQSFRPNTDWFLAYPFDKPELMKHLELIEFLGIPARGSQLEFPIEQADEVDAVQIMGAHGITKPYVVMHPGVASGTAWPPEDFAAVADDCARRGMTVVLTGVESEWQVARAVLDTMESLAVNLVGLTSLGALGALIKNSRLFIGNDTGTSHIATALEVPSIMIFTSNHVKRWAALNSNRHRSITPSEATVQTVRREMDELLNKKEV